MGDQTTTQTSEIGQASPEANQMIQVLTQLAQSGQLGDLSQLASGNIQANASDRALVEGATGAAYDTAARQAEQAYRDTQGQVEETLLQRGMDDSTVGAVTQAIQGREYQRQLGDIASQQQGQTAQGLMQMPLQRAGMQVDANRAILERILGGTSGVMGHNIQQQLGNVTQTMTQPFDWAGMAQGAGQTAAGIASFKKK